MMPRPQNMDLVAPELETPAADFYTRFRAASTNPLAPSPEFSAIDEEHAKLGALHSALSEALDANRQDQVEARANAAIQAGGRQVDGGPLGQQYGLAPKAAAMAAQVMAQFPGLRISSGYRDPAHNAAVGGVPNSLHTQGRAVDLSGSADQMQRAVAWGKANGATEALYHNAGSGYHAHLAW